MKEKAEKILEDMRQQEAYLVKQLQMTQGAVQVLEGLLQEDKEEEPEEE